MSFIGKYIMYSIDITSINLQRVLEILLLNPNKLINYDDLINIREVTAESRIREALRKLESAKIINVDYSRGRPKGGNRKKNYQLQKNLETFEGLFNIYLKVDVSTFLKSEYTNEIIKKYGFCAIYEIIKKRLEESDFRYVATNVLLSQPATIDDLESLPEDIFKRLEENREFGVYLSDLSIEEINALRKFDPLTSVMFCRTRLYERFKELHKKVGGKMIVNTTEPAFNFTFLDYFLSPFTSYPVYDPIQLLFSRPFDRLYEDAYLLDKVDFMCLIKRAHLVYENFVDLLSLYFKNLYGAYEFELETSVKEFVFLWNVSSIRFDRYCSYLNIFYSHQKGSGKYHLLSDGILLQVTDLETNIPLLDPNESKEMPFDPPLYLGDSASHGLETYDPFGFLIPCNIFKNEGFDYDPIPVEAIVAETNSKLGEMRGR